MNIGGEVPQGMVRIFAGFMKGCFGFLVRLPKHRRAEDGSGELSELTDRCATDPYRHQTSGPNVRKNRLTGYAARISVWHKPICVAYRTNSEFRLIPRCCIMEYL